jgi:hypothetical protein
MELGASLLGLAFILFVRLPWRTKQNRFFIYNKEDLKMKKVLLATLTVLLVMGCATTYHSTGFTGGFSETQLSENIFQVRFKGNGFTSMERASDFCLLRSAELAKENGFFYFIIIDSNSSSNLSTYTTPTTTESTGNAFVNGNNIYGNSTMTTYGGQTYVIRKPSTMNSIVCFKEKPEIKALIYESGFVIKSIRNKYDIKD